ncbi:MAG: hypothetical protein PHS14_16840 [Elusimicrobia bacterium]|nr:hypothetical protein [Elusimicrobiota bacterium]
MRRVLVLAVLIAASLGRAAAQSRTAPASVQLSLSFAAPAPALLAPLTVSALQPSLAPAVLSVAPALSAPAFAAAPKPVMAAFHTGDPSAYLKAARAAEYEPPEGDEHQSALYQLGLEREAADRAARTLFASPAPAARATAIDYEEFGRQLSRHPGLSLNAFSHTDAKRRILKASGYSRLHGAGGVPVPIERADDARVGKAFANVLRAFDRR